MIETVSYPSDLKTWDPKAQPYYLELFGETTPVVNPSFAEVLPAGPLDGAPVMSQPAPIYEYWWTIGHPGHAEHRVDFWEFLGGRPDDLWDNLKEPAARVYLFFPISGGWRIKELAATVKYLTPVKQQKDWWNAVAKDWQVIQPLVSDVSTLAGAVAPAVGGAASGAATLLSTIAKLKINSVPQVDGFEWSVGKVTFGSGWGVMQGIMWTLPKKMFTELGGRLTGSVALSFVPARTQPAQSDGQMRDSAEQYQFERLSVLAHAAVYGQDETIWAPAQREFIKLRVQPTLPTVVRKKEIVSPRKEPVTARADPSPSD